MKILFVAPEICSPWSEGRKVFVRDLIEALHKDHEILVLTTAFKNESGDFPVENIFISCSWKPELLLKILFALPEVINDFRPDVVCHFPYGTFQRYYGVINKLYISILDKVCRKKNTHCLSIMYSIDSGITAKELSKSVSNLVTGQKEDGVKNLVETAINFKGWPDITKEKTNTLLFMAGMWQTNTARVDHVLNVRGLSVLLKAGEYIDNEGIKLIIASPLFSDSMCREYLLNSKYNKWDSGSIVFESSVSVPDIYRQADLFIFPYSKNIQHFVPTSVIESMVARTPVVLSDIPLFSDLINDNETGFYFENECHVSLANKIKLALSDEKRLFEIGLAAKKYAKNRWSIEASAKQLIDLAERVQCQK